MGGKVRNLSPLLLVVSKIRTEGEEKWPLVSTQPGEGRQLQKQSPEASSCIWAAFGLRGLGDAEVDAGGPGPAVTRWDGVAVGLPDVAEGSALWETF